mmetsp:Transcript_49317/g.127969  ORF Transcript_49317/g.127969 Transcript_49317/m.127969 type:complete len:239 (+) Transcript_49317:445-1161(+)
MQYMGMFSSSSAQLQTRKSPSQFAPRFSDASHSVASFWSDTASSASSNTMSPFPDASYAASKMLCRPPRCSRIPAMPAAAQTADTACTASSSQRISGTVLRPTMAPALVCVSSIHAVATVARTARLAVYTATAGSRGRHPRTTGPRGPFSSLACSARALSACSCSSRWRTLSRYWAIGGSTRGPATSAACRDCSSTAALPEPQRDMTRWSRRSWSSPFSLIWHAAPWSVASMSWPSGQ